MRYPWLMGTHILTRPVSVSASGISLPPWISLIVRKVRRALLSEEEKQLLVIVEAAAGDFGKPLLDARDLEDLDNLIEVQLERQELNTLNSLMARSLASQNLEALGQNQLTKDEIAKIGLGAPDAIASVFALMKPIMGALARLLHSLGEEAIHQVIDQIQTKSPLWFLTDESVPPEVGSLMLSWTRAGICSMALSEALMSGRKLKLWLARGLAERWLQGAHDYLRLLASLPDTDVPLDLVPESERLNLPRLSEETRASRERQARLIAEAHASRLPVYPPGALTDTDDDD